MSATTRPIDLHRHVAVLSGKLSAARKKDPHGDHSALEAELKNARLKLHVQALVDEAPPLSAEVRADLDAIIRGGDAA